jgi:putative membrane protein
VSDLPVETQPERTALSWQRTGLGVLAVGSLIGHRAVVHRQPVLLALAGAVALLGLVIVGVLAHLRYRRLRRAVATGAAVLALH